MQIGVARTRISPPWGVELAGWGYYLRRTWQRVRDHTAATAIVFEEPSAGSGSINALTTSAAISRKW